MNAVLVMQGITKSYRMGEVEVPALRGIDLELSAGEMVVLLGASGSGKSTLLNILGGLDVPTAGHIRYRDHELTNANERALTIYRRDHVGFVFQFYNLIPSLTAIENVALVTDLANKPLSPGDALELVGLTDRRKHRPGELSGGQQQRVAIARAIVADPTLLICDEPTGDLDRETTEEILRLLQLLNREHGKTIVMVTHDPKAASFAGRIVHLDKGALTDAPAETAA